MPKPRTKNNQRAGRMLQRIRIENCIFEQQELAEKVGFLENKVRDREIGVASVTTVDILRIAYALDMEPIEMASRMIAPIAITLDKVTNDGSQKIGLWVKSGKFGEIKRWCGCVIEKDFPGKWVPYDDYQDGLLFANDTIEDIRRDREDEVKAGKRQPFEMKDCSHLGRDWELDEMKKQGRRLKAARLRKGYASQWAAANDIGVNPSWAQVREAANVVIKLEDLIAIAEAWDMSPYQLIEIIYDSHTPDDNQLKEIRRKYC